MDAQYNCAILENQAHKYVQTDAYMRARTHTHMYAHTYTYTH